MSNLRGCKTRRGTTLVFIVISMFHSDVYVVKSLHTFTTDCMASPCFIFKHQIQFILLFPIFHSLPLYDYSSSKTVAPCHQKPQLLAIQINGQRLPMTYHQLTSYLRGNEMEFQFVNTLFVNSNNQLTKTACILPST